MGGGEAEIAALIPRLRRYATALTGDRGLADDLVQDCLERMLSRWRLWRPGSNLPAWAFTVLRNLWIDELRRRGHRPDSVALEDAPETACPPAQGASLALRDLAAALAHLPPDQREVVLLVGLEGLSYAEAAQVTGVPPGTVMSRLKRGRDRLAALMRGEGPMLRRVK